MNLSNLDPMRVAIILVSLVFAQVVHADNSLIWFVVGNSMGSSSRDGEVITCQDKVTALKAENDKLHSVFQNLVQELGQRGFVYIPPKPSDPCHGLTQKECREKIRKERGY